jgi:hypothetical protein
VIKNRFFSYLLSTIVILIGGTVAVNATTLINNVQTSFGIGNDRIGSINKIDDPVHSTTLYTFTLTTDQATAEILSSLPITVNGTLDSNNKDDVKFFLDKTPSGNTPPKLLQKNDNFLIISPGESIATGNTTIYSLKVAINSTSQIGKTFDVILNGINTTQLTVAGFREGKVTVNKTLSIIPPTVVFPGQKNVVMAQLSFEISDPPSGANTTFSIENNAIIPFATSSNATKGVIKVSLYKGNDPNLHITDNRRIMSLDAGMFTSVTRAAFSFSSLINVGGTVIDPTQKSDFLITYDIGKDTVITNDAKVSFKLKELSIPGQNMPGSAMKWINNGLAQYEKDDVALGGLLLKTIQSIVPKGTFGANTTVPALKLEFHAINTALTLNTIIIVNTGTVPFRTQVNDTDITQVNLYYDNDRNGLLSYSSSDPNGDSLIGSSTIGNSDKLTQLTITKAIKKFDPDKSYKNKDTPSDMNNSALFFVTYTFGATLSGAKGSQTSTAQLGTTKATMPGISELNLSGVSDLTPAIASPDAVITLSDTNVNIAEIHDISLDAVLQGQIKAPVLFIKIKVENKGGFVSTNFQIQNSEGNFLSDSTGVDKVWIYRDSNNNGLLDLDSSDEFLAASQGYASTSVVNITGIRLTKGFNNLFVVYDIGQIAKINTPGNRINAQLINISSAGKNLVLGGLSNTTHPLIMSIITQNYFNFQDIQLSADPPITEISDATITQSITVTLKNRHATTVTVNQLFPKMYLDNISGADITSEFSVQATTLIPFSLSSQEVTSNRFNFRHTRALSNSAACIDLYLEYQITPTQSARIQRYNTNGYNGAATSPNSCFKLPIIKTIADNPWEIPSYIYSTIYQRSSGVSGNFYNQLALEPTDTLIITFHNKGFGIDASSLQLKINNTSLIQVSCTNANTPSSYCYDTQWGQLTIPKVGEASGTLTLSVSDFSGNPLPSTVLLFTVSSQKVNVTTPLFFPSPYKMGSGPLTLGFNLNTKPGRRTTVKVYFFNALGQLVHTKEKEFFTTGYHTIPFDANSSFLVPGGYLVKVVATNDEGQSIGTTKLGIH